MSQNDDSRRRANSICLSDISRREVVVDIKSGESHVCAVILRLKIGDSRLSFFTVGAIILRYKEDDRSVFHQITYLFWRRSAALKFVARLADTSAHLYA